MLRTLFKRGQPIELKSKDLMLKTPVLGDYQQWHEVRAGSRKYLTPFEPTWSETELELSSFKERARRAEKEAMEGVAYAFFIHDMSGPLPTIVGGLNLSDVRRRVSQSVNIGYWMSEQQSNKGIMTNALNLALPFIFDVLELHRANAACLTDNMRSVRVLEKNGFQHEGSAEGFLKINGKWQDHLLYGLTKERFEANRAAK